MSHAAEGPDASKVVRVSQKMSMEAHEMVQYMFREDVVKAWLGDDAKLKASGGSEVTLTRADGDGLQIEYLKGWTGVVTECAWCAFSGENQPLQYRLVVRLEKAHVDPVNETLEIRVVHGSSSTSRVRIIHSDISEPKQIRSDVRLWQGALNRLLALTIKVRRERKRTRQAIVIVHGIGEQQPGQMLRSFARTLFSRPGDMQYVKPNQHSSLIETRYIKMSGTNRRPPTDIYELYWAHLVRDTTLSQVYGWFWRLVTAPAERIPETLVYHVRVFWGLVFVAANFGIWWMKDGSVWLAGLSGFGAAIGVTFIPLLSKLPLEKFRDNLLLGYAGDAARYLEARPGNIARRQQIREEGVALINSLHESNQYGRIILYGHSLGSVIAYDILNHCWTRRHRDHENKQSMTGKALRAVERLLRSDKTSPDAKDIDAIQAKQLAAWQEYRDNGFSWLISDFVTAGSPLAHGPWLLNRDKHTAFEDLIRERSFPTCPPQAETRHHRRTDRTYVRITYTHAFPDAENPKKSRSVLVPHDAAPFAITRWTNLYFPHSGVARGDPIGGRVSPRFGPWVNDVALTYEGDAPLGFAHTEYTNRNPEATHAATIRKALKLRFGEGLTDPINEVVEPIVLR